MASIVNSQGKKYCPPTLTFVRSPAVYSTLELFTKPGCIVLQIYPCLAKSLHGFVQWSAHYVEITLEQWSSEIISVWFEPDWFTNNSITRGCLDLTSFLTTMWLCFLCAKGRGWYLPPLVLRRKSDISILSLFAGIQPFDRMQEVWGWDACLVWVLAESC